MGRQDAKERAEAAKATAPAPANGFIVLLNLKRHDRKYLPGDVINEPYSKQLQDLIDAGVIAPNEENEE